MNENEFEFEETPLVMENRETPRGFSYNSFRDIYEQECSLQKSSLATQPAIWFGVDNTGPHIEGPSGKVEEAVGVRMHLSRKQVEDLLPTLQKFVQTGEL